MLSSEAGDSYKRLLQKSKSREVRGDPVEDPRRVDWVTSHHALERPPKKIMRGKTNGNKCVPKIL